MDLNVLISAAFSLAYYSLPSLTHPVHPVFEVFVSHTSVEGVWREDEDEVARVPDTVEEVVIELSRSQLLNVQECGETAQLEVNLEQTEGKKEKMMIKR